MLVSRYWSQKCLKFQLTRIYSPRLATKLRKIHARDLKVQDFIIIRRKRKKLKMAWNGVWKAVLEKRSERSWLWKKITKRVGRYGRERPQDLKNFMKNPEKRYLTILMNLSNRNLRKIGASKTKRFWKMIITRACSLKMNIRWSTSQNVSYKLR